MVAFEVLLKDSMKIVSVVGGRPNFIKLAAICRNLDKKFRHLILHTGQHYSYKLSEIFFRQLRLPKTDFNLEVGSGSQAYQVAKILLGCEDYFQKIKPSLVIVYGDMNSTLAAALAASKLNIPVAHVEAGLRSFDKSMPEEINRIITDHISDILFSPTSSATQNLKREGLGKITIERGDPTYDTFKRVEKELKESYYQRLQLAKCGYYYVTIHRLANADDRQRLTSILEAIRELKLPVIFPIHPRTKKMIDYFNLKKLLDSPNITVTDPKSYIESLSLQKFSRAVITDSGGIQREAYYLKKYCITIRENTEWPQTVKSGWNTLWFPQKRPFEDILKNVKMPTRHANFFGDGNSGLQIAKSIKNFLESR